MNFRHYCFVFPLDHPLSWQADHQAQTVRIISGEYSGKVALYHAYLRRKTWSILFSPRAWISFTKQLLAANKTGKWEFSPIHVLPFERFEFIYQFNTRLSFYLFIFLTGVVFRSSTFVLWLFHPRFFEQVDLVKKIMGKKAILLYDCLDYFELLNTKEEKKLRISENNLIRMADVVTANSASLFQKHLQVRSDIELVPSGFRLNHFRSKQNFASFKKENKGSILFVGTINYRLHFSLLEKIIKKNPQWKFQFVGPIDSQEDNSSHDIKKRFLQLSRFPNFHYHDYVHPKKLSSLFFTSQVGIIPYSLKVAMNKYCSPLKLLEYFYFGLPVVAVPLQSLKRFSTPSLRTANSLHEWEKSITHFMNHRPTLVEQKQMRKIALDNSWEKKIATTLSSSIFTPVDS